MGSLSDVRPLLHTARLFGCGLFLVKEDDIVIMKYGAIYSALFALLYAGLCGANFYMLRWDDVLGPRLLTLTVVRTGLSYACVLSDITMTFWYNWKIRAALSHLRVFDRATRYKEPRHRIRHVCWALAFVILSFWSVVGYITFCVEPKDSVFNGVTYAIVNATLSMQLMTFASLTSLLYERYRRLCELLLLPEDGKIMVVDRSGKQFRLQEVWWLHSCLTNATEMINSVYALQLLLWISCMSFNTLTRIYTINDNGAVSQPLLMDCSMEAVTYFQLQQVHFFAFHGIIRIDLPLLLSIASGITTYLVILHTANV
ncbi:PREDICTED: uncharacterized protein LOC105564220 isoform X3 [Vollenhovia emeryi]|uniref:uncharacterized protein LOC105564220 isoform X3 n=1 Tax=Vollenhovia emeryi TaxID=411798 RepID=UPI0005F3C273|nr:PREDICTED: uncharacterized protein LOC105564220 isoform X3 [Vollenhovia emeryi]